MTRARPVGFGRAVAERLKAIRTRLADGGEARRPDAGDWRRLCARDIG